MASTTNDVELPDRPEATPTEFLIRHHLSRLGCNGWTREKFLRLARALGETSFELGARIGMSRSSLLRRLETGRFTTTEGLVLSLHYRFLEYITSGRQPEDDLFYGIHQGTGEGLAPKTPLGKR